MKRTVFSFASACFVYLAVLLMSGCDHSPATPAPPPPPASPVDADDSVDAAEDKDVPSIPPPPLVDSTEDKSGLTLTTYSASKGKYFQRKEDAVLFGSKMALWEYESIDDYDQINIPSFTAVSGENQYSKCNFEVSEDKTELSINIFGRGPEPYFDTFVLQPNGPKGEFPVGRWVSKTSKSATEEIIITEFTLFRYSSYGRLPEIEYPYEISGDCFYFSRPRYITPDW